LTTLRKLTTEETFRDLGFESVNEAERATLGEPIQFFYVRLDQLREFKPEDDPNELLIDAKRYLYPVLVDGKLRSAVTVEMLKGKFVAVGFGGASLVAEYDKVRLMKSADGRKEFKAVQIPSMQLNFLAHSGPGSDQVLTPLPSNVDADVSTNMFHSDKAIVGYKVLNDVNTSAANIEISPRYGTSSTDQDPKRLFQRLVPMAKTIDEKSPR